jgi:hypothetical protein
MKTVEILQIALDLGGFLHQMFAEIQDVDSCLLRCDTLLYCRWLLARTHGVTTQRTTINNYFWDYKINENEMCGACSTHAGD